MPSEFGGSSTSKEYAPHMWIGDDFVGGDAKEFTVGDWTYNVGEKSDGTIVAEKRLAADTSYPRNWELIPANEIPEEVREAQKGAFTRRQKEVASLKKIFNGED
jgi:hypothetical protein